MRGKYLGGKDEGKRGTQDSSERGKEERGEIKESELWERKIKRWRNEERRHKRPVGVRGRKGGRYGGRQC